MSKIVDPKVMAEFEANLGVFTKAIKNSNNEIEILLRKPGIDSPEIRERIHLLKAKLGAISAKWNDIAIGLEKELGISIEENEKYQEKIKGTLETNL